MSNFNAIRQRRLFSAKIASYRFSPGVFSTLLTFGLLYIMISLGFWQLDRAEYKDTLQQKIEQRKSLTALSLDELPATADDRRFNPVAFIGKYDAAHTFLLDNKTFDGRVGYHVLTPVKIDATRSILVNRGFVAQGRSRALLPEIETVDGEIMLTGLLDLPPPHGLILGDNINDATHWPVVIQYVDLDKLSQLSGHALYDMVLWLDKEEVGEFEYDLPVLNLNSAKNNGYAFQWFALSFALLMIYIFVNTKKSVAPAANH